VYADCSQYIRFRRTLRAQDSPTGVLCYRANTAFAHIRTRTMSDWSDSTAFSLEVMLQTTRSLTDSNRLSGADFIVSKIRRIPALLKCCHSVFPAEPTCEAGGIFGYDLEYFLSGNERVDVVERDMIVPSSVRRLWLMFS
jgi:hypothetical protein